MADNSLQFLQGLAVDWASTEISVDGQPFAAGFTSLEYSTKLTPEMLYVNGDSAPQSRTRGKAEYEGSAELPFLNYEALKARLGGVGADGLQHMVKEWTLTVSARPLKSPSIYTTRLERVRITSDGGGGSQGSASMVKLSLSIMKVRPLPPG